jgi:hypothetical protein
MGPLRFLPLSSASSLHNTPFVPMLAHRKPNVVKILAFLEPHHLPIVIKNSLSRITERDTTCYPVLMAAWTGQVTSWSPTYRLCRGSLAGYTQVGGFVGSEGP